MMNAWATTRNLAVTIMVFVLTTTAAIVEVHGGDGRELFIAALIAVLFYKKPKARADDSIQEIIDRVNNPDKGDPW